MGMSIIKATGLSRGDLLALQWQEIDLNEGQIKVNRNLQYINKQIVILLSKTKAGWRTVALPITLTASLKQNRQWQRMEHIKKGLRTDQVIHNRNGEATKQQHSVLQSKMRV